MGYINLLIASNLVFIHMNFSAFLDLLGPYKEQVVNFYSIASLLVSLVLLLWIFNLIAGFIHRTFLLGRAFGKIYRNYMHSFLKATFIRIINLFSSDSDLDKYTIRKELNCKI